MSHFIHKKQFILSGSLVLLCGMCALFFFAASRIHYESAAMTESSEILNNPYCGFYHLYGYLLSDKGRKPAQQWCENMLASDSQSILLLQINLKNYSGSPISSTALDQLDTILSTFSSADRQIIVRFLYDWDGSALQTEPASQDRILSHMKQVAPVVNRFSSHVFLLQGIFTGNCGEMNQTHYGDREHLSDLPGYIFIGADATASADHHRYQNALRQQPGIYRNPSGAPWSLQRRYAR